MSRERAGHEQRDNGPDDQARALFHELSNALTRILTASEFIEQAVQDDEQTLHDAQIVREAALESRDILQRLRETV